MVNKDGWMGFYFNVVVFREKENDVGNFEVFIVVYVRELYCL